EHAAETAKYFIPRLSDPFNGVRPKCPRRRHRTCRRPPPAESRAVDKRHDHNPRHGADVHGYIECRLGCGASGHQPATCSKRSPTRASAISLDTGVVTMAFGRTSQKEGRS